MKLLLRVAALASVLPVPWMTARAQQTPPAAQVDFTRDIQPILQSQCYECHGAEKARGRLRLDRRAAALAGGATGAAVIPGNSEGSLLIRRILGLDDEERMPKDGDPLPEAQIVLLRAWIDQGAAWPGQPGAATEATETPTEPEHWGYRAPKRPPLPDVRTSGWVRSPIDRFVLARLEKEGLEPSPQAPLYTLVRRASLDLIGLPPSPQEVDAVLAEAARDGQDAAYERLVDRLLASPHYGERWARPWLDLARYADSHGFEKDLPRVMWKYRDWVIDALNRDMPFDRFTVEQIAGDMLPNATRDQIVASGFHRNAMTNEEGGIDPGEAHHEVLVDRVGTTATVWLGTTLACAQCHNHKYDPFSQKDYYRMMAFFSNTDYEVRRLGDGTKFTEASIDVPTAEQEAQRKVLQSEIDTLTTKLETQTPALDRAQRLWEASARGEAAARWRVVTPEVLDGGEVTLTGRPDGSVVAGGPSPGYAVHTVEGTTLLPRITAIRLEALPDPSLPKGGPGRDTYGNFQLNGFEAEVIQGVTKSVQSASLSVRGAPPPLTLARRPASGRLPSGASLGPQALTFASIKSDDGGASLDTFFPKNPPRDAYAPRGWRIDASREDERRPRQIVFTLERPIVAPGGTRLRMSLKHLSTAVGQAIGRFRLSVTGSATPQRIVEIPARLRPVLDLAPAARTEQQQKDLAAFHRTVAPSLKPARERLAALQREVRALAIPTALVMRERPAHTRPSAFMRRRGSFLDKGEQVYAGVPGVLHPLRDDHMPNRLGLAYWLVDEANPLTARVAVNRAWETLFGRGLVETSEDFGTQGTPPSHPELLDWLATEFVRQGWRVKSLHRSIVLSATYRQSSAATPALVERDPYNRLLARGARFRMEAEMIRDHALAASGLLTRAIGGPSVFPPQPEGIWDIPYSSEKWMPSTGADRHRRGLYTFIRRSAAYPSLMTFDGTSREFCTVRRVRTNTPLQALTMLNDEAYFEAARGLAARVLKEAQPAGRATYAFRLVTGRAPSAAEAERLAAAHGSHRERFRNALADAARVSGDYRVEGVDAAEQAAWALVANSLLNLDEALTRP
ncbi:MAG TPA: PSD1 and planctomycete cytochrome C domain-containing protein [Vicinamibacterales bacterium]|jgi:cytochrome c553|nr:PSD1 and planctomycete cytochrome C domain-containing protein [Vicinamibacterales bacterium]